MKAKTITGTLFFFFLIVLYGQDNVQVLPSYLIDPSAPSSTFSYYNSTPESPDGMQLVYLRFDKIPESNYGNDAALWLLDLNSRRNKKIATIENANIHDGAMNCWVNDHIVAYQDGRLSSINLDDYKILKGKGYDKVSVVNTKTLEKKTFSIRGRIGHNTYNNKILITAMHEMDGKWGLYEIDVESGSERFICDPASFEPFVSEEIKQGKDVKHWKLLHAYFSPDGKKVAMRMVIRGKKEINDGGGMFNQLVIVNVDGTEPMVFGPNPLHFGWYDNTIIYGFAGHKSKGSLNTGAPQLGKYSDENGGLYLFRIADRDSVECIDKVSVFGNHIGISPDKNWYASENWYREDSLELRIYKKYEWKPAVIAAKNFYGKRAWYNPGPIHVNPAFSRDGTRLYFTEVTDGIRFQAKWVDLRGIINTNNN